MPDIFRDICIAEEITTLDGKPVISIPNKVRKFPIMSNQEMGNKLNSPGRIYSPTPILYMATRDAIEEGTSKKATEDTRNALLPERLGRVCMRNHFFSRKSVR